MPSVLVLVLASAGSDAVYLPKETVAESAENMRSSLEGLAFRQPSLDYHRMMSLVAAAAEAAGRSNTDFREDPSVRRLSLRLNRLPKDCDCARDLGNLKERGLCRSLLFLLNVGLGWRSG